MPKDNINKAKTIITAAITDFVSALGLFDESYSVEEKVREFVKGISYYVDLRKMISYGQILVEFDEDEYISVTGMENAIVTSCVQVDEMAPEAEVPSKTALCKALKIVKYFIGMDNSKHVPYRVEVGLEPNDDITHDKMLAETGLTNEQVHKIYDSGYDIIKRVDQ